MSVTTRTHRLGLYLKSRDRRLSRNIAKKVGHHELQAAHAEEERRILQRQLWRQKLEFREAHQKSLTEMEELQKFQSSTFDTIARRKLIEDQNTILELSGRVQELQNEVNCMSDSQNFQDAESVHSENSHVTSRPVDPTLHKPMVDLAQSLQILGVHALADSKRCTCVHKLGMNTSRLRFVQMKKELTVAQRPL